MLLFIVGSIIDFSNSPEDIVIESPLFSLKPIASLTNASKLAFSSSLIFWRTCSPNSLVTNLSLTNIAATILLIVPVGLVVVLTLLLTS